jgi:hypothetical protein
VSTISRVEAGQVAAQDELKWEIAGVLGERMQALWQWPERDDPVPSSAPGAVEPGPADEPAPADDIPADRPAIIAGEPSVLTVKELARVLGLHPTSIYAHLDAEDFPLKPLPLPGHRRFSRVQVERFLKGEDGVAGDERGPARPVKVVLPRRARVPGA